MDDETQALPTEVVDETDTTSEVEAGEETEDAAAAETDGDELEVEVDEQV